MRLYNALTNKRESFTAGDEPITLYVCGITPYDTTHLGHSFTYATFDVLIRYINLLGYKVRYVQNVTDIDDDILRKANEVQGDWRDVGNRWTKHFIADMKELNIMAPDHFPRATDVIPEIVEAVSTLLEQGCAYEAGGNVYFHVDSWQGFGKLSGIPRAEMLAIANERGNHPDDPHKRDPLDFVLWQAQAPDEPAWDSPWGPGRPGWHIECSSMAAKYLGQSLDIHGGGADLAFPHHECEIAQAECATGADPFVRFWMHTAMVRHEGEKMSKSLGNLVMVRDLLNDGISANALRLYMHAHHYRSEWEFDEAELEAAVRAAQLLEEAMRVEGGDGPPLNPRGVKNTFHEAMRDDLDTPTALAALEQYASELISTAKKGGSVRDAQHALDTMGQVFGLRLLDAEPEAAVSAAWDAFLPRFES